MLAGHHIKLVAILPFAVAMLNETEVANSDRIYYSFSAKTMLNCEVGMSASNGRTGEQIGRYWDTIRQHRSEPLFWCSCDPGSGGVMQRPNVARE